MPTTLAALVVDAADPGRLATFWADLLGWQITAVKAGEVVLRAPASDGWPLELVFVPVDDAKVGQNRVHLDLSSTGSQAQTHRAAWARELGAQPVDIGQVDVPWVVLADPEGNEFCVREPNPRFRDTGAVAAILVDATDPAALATFWSAATGWAVGGRMAGCEALRAPDGRGPWLEFWSVPRPKQGKNRLHLDVAPTAGADHRGEADRLIALGAHPVDVGQVDVPWVVLADPEGNEFCVLEPR